MPTDKPVYAFRLSVENLYGTVKISAHIVKVEDDGSVVNPGYHYPYEDQGYADLLIHQFADKGNPTEAHIEYHSNYFTADLPRAERMVKTLRTITRGMGKIRDAEGYLDGSDLPAHLFRLARILKINKFYVRNTREAFNSSGERWRTADGPSVRYWYDHALENIEKGNVGTYDN